MAMLRALLVLSSWCWVCASAWSGPAVRPRIQGFSHVGYLVADLDKSIAFYRDVLGYGEPLRLPAEGAEPATAFFFINGRQYVELRPGLTADQPDRWTRISYEVSDAEGMRRYLGEKGVPVAAAVERDRLGSLRVTVQDFEGNPVEFIQYVADSKLMQQLRQPRASTRISDRAFHTCLGILDEAKGLRFYRDILGFSEILRSPDDQKPPWINMRLPEAAVYLEWTMYPAGTPARQVTMRVHLGLGVPDIQAAIETVRDRWAALGRTMVESPSIGKNKRWQIGVNDPDGRRHELMELYTMK